MKARNLNFRWCLIVGGFGFLIGFVGPMIFAPDANQGPLLGILITGPLGFLLGGTCWFLSAIFHWNYNTQIKVAAACCLLIVGKLLWISLEPKPEWPGGIFEIQVTKCLPANTAQESALETIVLHERQIKKEIHGSTPGVYSAGEITYATPTVVKRSFYIEGTCKDFPVGFTGTYYVTNHPTISRDKAVLAPIPDFAKGL